MRIFLQEASFKWCYQFFRRGLSPKSLLLPTLCCPSLNQFNGENSLPLLEQMRAVLPHLGQVCVDFPHLKSLKSKV